MDGDGQERISTNRHGRGGAEQYGLRAAYSVFVGFSRNHSYYQPEKNAYCIVMKIAVTSSIDIDTVPYSKADFIF